MAQCYRSTDGKWLMRIGGLTDGRVYRQIISWGHEYLGDALTMLEYWDEPETGYDLTRWEKISARKYNRILKGVLKNWRA